MSAVGVAALLRCSAAPLSRDVHFVEGRVFDLSSSPGALLSLAQELSVRMRSGDSVGSAGVCQNNANKNCHFSSLQQAVFENFCCASPTFGEAPLLPFPL